VLAGTIGALVDGALGTAPKIFADAAVELVLGIGALAHQSLSFWNRNFGTGGMPESGAL
jgi:hypothetical protein